MFVFPTGSCAGLLTWYVGVGASFEHELHDFNGSIFCRHLDSRSAELVPTRSVRHVVQLVPSVNQHPGNLEVLSIRVERILVHILLSPSVVINKLE